MRLALDFVDDVPDRWAPLEAVVVYKAIDETGVVRLGQTNTPTVAAWEVAGMLLWALDSVRGDLADATEEGHADLVGLLWVMFLFLAIIFLLRALGWV